MRSQSLLDQCNPRTELPIIGITVNTPLLNIFSNGVYANFTNACHFPQSLPRELPGSVVII